MHIFAVVGHLLLRERTIDHFEVLQECFITRMTIDKRTILSIVKLTMVPMIRWLLI